jgi:hypothetical protein
VKNFGNDLLAVVDRLSEQLGPVTLLLDQVLDRIAPKTAALANTCVPPGCTYCTSEMIFTCCGKCGTGDEICWVHVWYSCFGSDCIYTCDYCGALC